MPTPLAFVIIYAGGLASVYAAYRVVGYWMDRNMPQPKQEHK